MSFSSQSTGSLGLGSPPDSVDVYDESSYMRCSAPVELDLEQMYSGSKSTELIVLKDHVLDPRGDLWVRAYGRGSWGPSIPLRFKVCSRTLARSSPMLDKLLYGGFAESNTEHQARSHGEWEIDLPECPPLATKQLFEIMHCQFVGLQSEASMKTFVPTASPNPQGNAAVKNEDFDLGDPPTMLEQLYDILVVADYFDSTAILRPWASDWASALSVKETSRAEIVRSAWVYFQLGLQNRYEAAVSKMALEFPNESQLDERKLPEAVPAMFNDAFTNLRRQASNALLTNVRHKIDALLQADGVSLGFCKRNATSSRYGGPFVTNEEALECEARMLGSLQRELHKHHVWPLPSTEDLKISPQALYDILSAFSKVRRHTVRHEYCLLNLEPTGLGTDSTGGFASYKYTAVQTEAKYMTRQRELVGVNQPVNRMIRKYMTAKLE